VKIELAPDRRARLTAHLQQLFSKEFDEKLSDFRAGEIVDLMLRTLGPAVYNQAVQDVRANLQTRLDDLEGEVCADGDP
jgi:uncharacterized protein (DUF2164 family)